MERITSTARGAALRLEVAALGDARAVLAGDRAAQREGRLVDAGARGVDARLGGRVVAVDDEGRVEVAVAGVAEDADRQLVRGADALDGRRASRARG